MTSKESTDEIVHREEQEYVTAERYGDAIHIQLACDGTFSIEEYKEFLKQIKRTTWLTRDEKQIDDETPVMSLGDRFVGKGECHECEFEGYIVENDIGTTYCPKCRSTNVGWPHR